MEFDTLMQKLIDNVVPYVVDGTDEEKAEMACNLEKIIRNGNKLTIETVLENNDEKRLNFIINKIKSRWNEKTLEEKKRDLLTDKVFEEIVDSSNEAQELAEKRNREGVICQDTELYNKLNKILNVENPDVKEYNKKYVNTYISEGILDLNYAFGYSDVMSMRVGRWNQNKN